MKTFTLDWILSQDNEFRYRMLGRLQSDCDFYLGCGNRCARQLWAGDEQAQVHAMKTIWQSLPETGKPQWLTWEKIEQYSSAMTAK